jgi:hypothetical protein
VSDLPGSSLSRRRFLATGSCAAAGRLLAEWLSQRQALGQEPGNPIASESSSLRAGVAKRVVTPPLGIPYLTSSGLGTNAPFTGLHDDLHARALALDDGTQAIAVLAVDSLGYDNANLGAGRNFTAELRKRIAAATGLRAQAVMLAATHTHSAPETIGLTPLRDTPGAADWLEQHLEALAATVIEAWKGRVPARARFGSTKISGVSRNRRILMKDGTLNRRGPVPAESDMAASPAMDEELAVLYLENEQRQPLGALLNYAAHPVVAMLLPLVSADFPGAAAAAVEKALPGVVCLFTNGAAGNINSIQVSTNFDDVEAIGRKLASAAVAEIERMKSGPPLDQTIIHTRSQIVTLEPRPCLSLAEAQRLAAERSTAANLRQLRLAQKLAEGPIQAEVQAMQLGPVKWISLPGEPFVEVGLELKRAGASFVVGYANGYMGYLPIRSAYSQGGYETDAGVWSRVAPGSAERLVEVARKLLKE